MSDDPVHGRKAKLLDEIEELRRKKDYLLYESDKDLGTAIRFRDERDKLRVQVEQLQVQLAGCSVAALGWAVDDNDCSQGDYGWSPAFEDVKKLRAEVDQYRANEAEIRKQLGRVAIESKALREVVESVSQRK